MCEKLAKILNKKLREKYKNKSKKGILLITTRLLDLTAPLLYDAPYGTILFNTYENENYNQIKFKLISYILNIEILFFQMFYLVLLKILMILEKVIYQKLEKVKNYKLLMK